MTPEEILQHFVWIIEAEKRWGATVPPNLMWVYNNAKKALENLNEPTEN